MAIIFGKRSGFLQRLLGGLLLLTVGLSGAPFVAPTEVNPPFRRDRVPLDSEAMAYLAQCLSMLVEAEALETADERRAAAQALALALALDPTNSGVRENLLELENGVELTRPDQAKYSKGKVRIWQILAWVSAPEAGFDGNILGEMMGDSVAVLDQEHPAAKALRGNSDQAKWDDWVAPVFAFNNTPTELRPDEIAGSDKPETKPAKRRTVVLEKAKIATVLFAYDENSGIWLPKLTTITMEASKASRVREDGSVGGFEIQIPGPYDEEGRIESSVAKPIEEAMQDLLGELPERGRVKLLVGDSGSYQFNKNQTNLTGAGFVLANSAINGNAPQGIVIAELDERNQMVLPEHFWRLLMALSEEGEGGRLVLPAEAEEYVVSFLALEKPDFLLKHEVLLASSPEEFVALSAGKPSDQHATAFAKFAEIVEKSDGNPIGLYIANRFVRQRLQEIIEMAPNHLSAKLLARQGAGMRPRYLSRKVLAAEIWRSLDIISELAKVDLFTVNRKQLERLDEIYEEMRTKIAGLERYADNRDRDLLKEGKDLTLTVRNLSKELGEKGGELEDRYTEIMNVRSEMVTENEEFVKKLSEICGDPM